MTVTSNQSEKDPQVVRQEVLQILDQDPLPHVVMMKLINEYGPAAELALTTKPSHNAEGIQEDYHIQMVLQATNSPYYHNLYPNVQEIVFYQSSRPEWSIQAIEEREEQKLPRLYLINNIQATSQHAEPTYRIPAYLTNPRSFISYTDAESSVYSASALVHQYAGFPAEAYDLFVRNGNLR